jgi:tripartite-type tricarboxylate transporter receptor subunit TctC
MSLSRFNHLRILCFPALRFFAATVSLVLLQMAPQSALAQDFPSKPIKIIVGFPPGGAADITARVVGAKMAEFLGQQIVVENRSGAAGSIAAGTVARSEPDGYTLLLAVIANAANESLDKNLQYRYGEHLTAVAPLTETANVLVVHPSLNVRNVSELVALAKSKPGEILYGAGGRGSSAHLAAELFNTMADTKLKPVQYKGAPDITRDLLTGEVKVTFSPIAPLLEFVKKGQLQALATTGPRRDPSLPDIPTLSEAGLAGYDMRLWSGLLAPAGTPSQVIERLSSAASRSMAADDIRTIFAAQGLAPLTGTSTDFDKFYRGEIEKWRKVAAQGALGE